MKLKISALSLLLFAYSSFAEELTLDEVLKRAEKVNNSVVEKLYESQNETLDLEISKIDRLPTFDFSSSASIEQEDDQTYTHKISISQTIYEGDSITNSIEKAEYEDEKAKLELENTINDVQLEVVGYYVEALKYQNQKKIYEASYNELKIQYDNEKIKYENKLSSKSDLLDLESDMLELETSIIEVENNYKIQLETLKKAISYDNSDDVTLVLPTISIQTIRFESDLNGLENSSTDLKIENLDMLIAEENIQISKADYLPSIDFSFDYSSSDSEVADSLQDWEWEAGISFSYELFDWGETKKAVQQTENSLAIQKVTKKETIEQLELDLKTKYYELEKYEKQIEAQKKLVEAREESYKIDKIKFENKYLDISDYLESEGDLTESKLDLINLETEYYLVYHEYLNLIK